MHLQRWLPDNWWPDLELRLGLPDFLSRYHPETVHNLSCSPFSSLNCAIHETLPSHSCLSSSKPYLAKGLSKLSEECRSRRNRKWEWKHKHSSKGLRFVHSCKQPSFWKQFVRKLSIFQIVTPDSVKIAFDNYALLVDSPSIACHHSWRICTHITPSRVGLSQPIAFLIANGLWNKRREKMCIKKTRKQ